MLYVVAGYSVKGTVPLKNKNPDVELNIRCLRAARLL